MRMPDAPAGGRRRLPLAVLGGAVAVAAVIALVTGVSGPWREPGNGADGSGQPDRATLSGSPAAPDPAGADARGVVELDHGVLDDTSARAAATDCLAAVGAEGFAPDASAVTVRYAVVQRTATGTSPVLVLEDAAGSLLLCDADGADRPAQAPVPAASAAEPVALLGNGRAAVDCDGTTTTGRSSSTWLSVDGAVATVQQRYVVGGTPGPWFRAGARDGIVHLQSWLDGPVPAGTAIEVEHQVLDAAGEPVAQSVLPTGRSPLSGCAGGSAQIG